MRFWWWAAAALAARCAVGEGGAEEVCDESATDAKSLVRALRRQDWTCATILAAAIDSTTLGINEVTAEIRTIESRLKQVKDGLAAESTLVGGNHILTPAYQWAQSGDSIFLNVKFSHKWDAPATMIQTDDVDNVTYGTTNFSIHAHKGNKHFVLGVDLLREIDGESSSWVMGSVGKMIVSLKKDSFQKEWWPRLNKHKLKPPNQQVWWDRQEMYDHERTNVLKNERARAPPKGFGKNLEKMKQRRDEKNEDLVVEQEKREEAGAEAAPEGGGGESTEDADEAEAKTKEAERAPRTAATKRADKRKRLAYKRANEARERVHLEGTVRAERNKNRTKLDLENVDHKLEVQYLQIDAEGIREVESGGLWTQNVSDVPEWPFPDVPKAQSMLFLKPKKKKEKKKRKGATAGESGDAAAPGDDADAGDDWEAALTDADLMRRLAEL